jgi:trehalose synthase
MAAMTSLTEVEVPSLPLSRFLDLVGPDRHGRLVAAGERTAAHLGDRIVWNVNSTASGGGVAEMLQVLVGYAKGAGIDVRWLVTRGDPEFFSITKRLHNRIHGWPGDEGDLGPAELQHYRRVCQSNVEPLIARIRPGDIVLLHDPQTAGLVKPMSDAGAHVIWRCHIGADRANEWCAGAWEFLRSELDDCPGFIFSRAEHVPPWVPGDRVTVIPPSIDPFSPKNQDLDRGTVAGILSCIGLTAGTDAPTTFVRRDGTTDRVRRRADIISDDGLLDPAEPLVVQVSRWDRLKDMAGVMAGFASEVVPSVPGAQLALVGPAVEGVGDDPEGAAVLRECIRSWEALPPEARCRIRLISLPMDDVDENAAMVNALQRHATVVVQKSLAEGFGLTVAEGMWKGKPLVASRVGGIVDQVVPGTGILLDDPADLEAFGAALAELLSRPDDIMLLGERARHHVLDHYVGDRHLLRYADLIEHVLTS